MLLFISNLTEPPPRFLATEDDGVQLLSHDKSKSLSLLCWLGQLHVLNTSFYVTEFMWWTRTDFSIQLSPHLLNSPSGGSALARGQLHDPRRPDCTPLPGK